MLQAKGMVPRRTIKSSVSVSSGDGYGGFECLKIPPGDGSFYEILSRSEMLQSMDLYQEGTCRLRNSITNGSATIYSTSFTLMNIIFF